ncbi:polysaccharide biosynthesis/export family protein [Baaleninema sp.]|uniref:polysaccharide biosynthesis/export family protein n=1 Tax=Baaleninema sp. TaxID=3101197 RepID=UPI003D018199
MGKGQPKSNWRSLVAVLTEAVLLTLWGLPLTEAIAQTETELVPPDLTRSESEDEEDIDLDAIPSTLPVWTRLQLSGEVQHRQMVEYLEEQVRQRLVRPLTPPDLSPLLPEEDSRRGPISGENWDVYRLAPGDALSVVVQPPFQDLTTSAEISFQGTIFMPLLGTVSLQGLTVEEATQKLRQELNNYVVNPDVQVVLASPRQAQVTVTGEVARPGFFPIPPNAPLVQAILNAGGVTIDADLRRVTVRRTLGDGRTLTQSLDLYEPLIEGTAIPDLRLRDGDVIVVPRRDRTFAGDYNRQVIDRSALSAPQQEPIAVTVIGEVARPGFYDFPPVPPPAIDTAILAAQGTKVTANLRRTILRRTLDDGTTLEREVDLFSPLVFGEALPEILLEDGDVVVVPELTAEEREAYELDLAARSTLAQEQIIVRVLSYPSNAASTQALPNGSTLADVLSGVPLNAARLSRVAVIRFDEDLGEAVTTHYDGREAILGNPEENPILQDKDVVVVGRNFIASLGNFLNNFTQPFRDVLGFLLFFDQLSNSADNLFRPTGTDNNNNN